MGKSWREPSKGVFGKGKGTNLKREASRKEEKNARREIERLTRRSGERIETFLD